MPRPGGRPDLLTNSATFGLISSCMRIASACPSSTRAVIPGWSPRFPGAFLLLSAYRRRLLVLPELAVLVAVGKVKHEAECHPDHEPEPGIEGQTKHERQTDERRKDRNERHEWGFERAMEIRPAITEEDH